MRFKVLGEKGNPVVVMLTGSFCPGECLEYLYSRMKEFYVIVPTYNGHYKDSKDFTTRENEAKEIKEHLIKLGIDKFSNKEQIVYQFAHELCHYVFYALKGLDKKIADNEEENICSAMSLILINILFSNQISLWISHVNRLKDEMYNKGGIIAKECNFDINKLKEKIYAICGK